MAFLIMLEGEKAGAVYRLQYLGWMAMFFGVGG
jgi:hypothetical protein